jgi:Nucleoside 2-deoxyribosyltransferase
MTDPKPPCYVASPYGFAESTRAFYYEKLLPLVGKYVTVLDPWAVDAGQKSWLDLGEHHLDTIANEARLVIACLDQEPPDNGTVVEVAWAAAHGIPVIGYRGDFRTTGEEGLPYNLMIGAAIRRSGGVAVSNLTELEQELQARLRS